MQENSSLMDILGIVSFLWSIISFYIGYQWYKDSVTKDALVARLTAENELLRREVQAISSADRDGNQHLMIKRGFDHSYVNKLKLFYEPALEYSYSSSVSGGMHVLLCMVLSGIIIWRVGMATTIGLILLYSPLLFLMVSLILWPFVEIVRRMIIARQQKKIQALLDEEGFSFEEILAAKNWIDQQDWRERDRKGDLKRSLCKQVDIQLARLESLGRQSAGVSATSS